MPRTGKADKPDGKFPFFDFLARRKQMYSSGVILVETLCVQVLCVPNYATHVVCVERYGCMYSLRTDGGDGQDGRTDGRADFLGFNS